MSQRQVIVYSSAELLSKATAERILLCIGDYLNHQQLVNVALTGGRDANDIYDFIRMSELSETVDWKRVHIWWSDERFVPVEDQERNEGQAREAWLNSLTEQNLLPESNIHTMPADSRSSQQIASASDADNDAALQKAAQAYNDEIVHFLGNTPSFDLSIFGVGPDGHFASLFPDRSEVTLTDSQTNVVGVSNSPKLPPLRLSLTIPCIRRSRKVWFFASTSEKTQAVKAALSVHDSPHVPSSFGNGLEETLWLVDNDAAVLLNSHN